VPEVIYGSLTVPYRVSLSNRVRGRIRIHVHADGTIEVERPDKCSANQLKAAVQKRARWIFDSLKAVSTSKVHVQPKEYNGGETWFYLGRRYRLDIKKARGEPKVKLYRGRLSVELPVVDKAAVKQRLRSWYKQRARVYLTHRLTAISAEIPWLKEEPQLKFLSMKYRWGSCSPRGAININPALIRAPRHCIDYVLIHEICHLREHNHSKKFYALLKKHCPDWVKTKAELDQLAELILAQ
jgi:predicted metal-dependent hydrolase